MNDQKHRKYLLNQQKNKSYYMGVWHTHPQNDPIPSSIDWNDWNETLRTDKTACEYVFFIIAGISSIRVWVGEFETNEITEIFECEKDVARK